VRLQRQGSLGGGWVPCAVDLGLWGSSPQFSVPRRLLPWQVSRTFPAHAEPHPQPPVIPEESDVDGPDIDLVEVVEV